jgi:ParB family chromosome partitioning protein
LNEIEKQRELTKNIIELSLSVRETEKAIKRLNRSEGVTVEKKQVKLKNDANVQAAETKLRRYLGTNIQIIPDGKGTGGKIEVEYYGEADLDRIFNLILNKKD